MMSLRFYSAKGTRECHVCGLKIVKGLKHVRVVSNVNHDYLNLCFQCINMARVGANIDRLTYRLE